MYRHTSPQIHWDSKKKQKNTHTDTDRDTGAQTNRHTDEQTHRHTDTQTRRHTDTKTRTDTQTHTDTRRHKQTNAEIHRHTWSHLQEKVHLSASHYFRRHYEQEYGKKGGAVNSEQATKSKGGPQYTFRLYLSPSLHNPSAGYYLTVLSLSSAIPSSIRTSLISFICLVKVCFQAVRTMWIVAVSLQSMMMRCMWSVESFARLLTSKLLIDASLRFRDMIVSEGSPVSAFVEWIVWKRRRVLPSMCTQMQPHTISNAQTYAHWRKTVCFCRLTLMYLPKRLSSKVSERTAREQTAQHCQCMVSNIWRTIHHLHAHLCFRRLTNCWWVSFSDRPRDINSDN